MDKLVWQENIEVVARQRNGLLVLAVVAIFSGLLLSFKIASVKERIILVPGLNQEIWVTDSGVSRSYLEEVTAMYLPLLLDLSSETIDWKKEHLFKHVSQSDSAYMKSLAEYFARSKEKYKQFSLSTHFAIKNFEVNEKKLLVKASGQLVSRFGERGFQSESMSYLLQFEWKSGKLLLKEFAKWSEEEGKEKGDGK
jgi:type IV conjugative transfer system protein TraE